MNTQELLTAEEIARRLKVSPRVVRAMANQDRIPALRSGKKFMRFDYDRVVEALETR